MRCGIPYGRHGIAIILIVVLACFMACHHTDRPMVEAFESRENTPLLLADTVTTLISDSGITRYRITTSRWEVYDKARPPHWLFPVGILLERFNNDLETEASLEADYAYYNEEAQLWELDGNVKAVNLEGEVFETQQLFWSQREERVYSDSLIRITRETSIITGIGFESNQEMTRYTIRKPQGVFPLKEE